jgi:predicted acyltransferase
LLLALFYLLIDVLGFRRWAFPFVVIGSNAILIYVIWDFVNPFPMMSKTIFGGLASHLGTVGAFLLAFAAVAMWWIILYDLYRRKIFLRI